MKTVTEIIDDLGGLTVCAKATGSYASAVSGWKDRNFIPRWHRDALLKLAKKNGIALTKDDFPVKQPTKTAA